MSKSPLPPSTQNMGQRGSINEAFLGGEAEPRDLSVGKIHRTPKDQTRGRLRTPELRRNWVLLTLTHSPATQSHPPVLKKLSTNRSFVSCCVAFGKFALNMMTENYYCLLKVKGVAERKQFLLFSLCVWQGVELLGSWQELQKLGYKNKDCRTA